MHPEFEPSQAAPRRRKPVAWIAILFAAVVLGTILYSTFSRGQRYRCRICITYRGQTDCRTGSALTQMEAQRTATIAACAQLSGGVIESNKCESTPPDSLE